MSGKQQPSGYPFESARQLRMRTVFEKAARQGYVNDTESVDLKKFEQRFERIQSKMTAHLDRHEPAWISRETAKLLQKHKGLLEPTLSPKWVIQTETSPAAIAQKAWRNVEARKRQRLTKLNEIGNRLKQTISNTTGRSEEDYMKNVKISPKL